MRSFFIALILLMISVDVFASDCINVREMSKNKEVVRSMYRYFESLQTQVLKQADLTDFYTPGVEMIINGHLVSKGIGEFYAHFKLMLSKSKNYAFIFPKNAIIAEHNRLAIKYAIEMRGKVPEIIHVMAYFTFKHGKITKWDEVVSKQSAHALGISNQEKSS